MKTILAFICLTAACGGSSETAVNTIGDTPSVRVNKPSVYVYRDGGEFCADGAIFDYHPDSPTFNQCVSQ